MRFKCLFGIEIAIGIEHVDIIVLFDFDSDPDPDPEKTFKNPKGRDRAQ